MKQTVFALAMCFMASVAWSQNITFHQSDKSGKRLPTQRVLKMLPSSNEDELLVVEAKLNAVGEVKSIQVRQINDRWKESAIVKIDNTRGCSVEAFGNGDCLHLLLASFDKKGSSMRHVVLNVSPLRVISDSLLAEMNLGEDEQCLLFRAVSSPSNNYHAVVFTKESDVGDQATAMLYDGEMKRLRVCKLPHGAVRQILVTDRGEVVTACLLSSNSHEQSLLRFNVANSSELKSGEVVLKGDLEQLALLNYAGGKILCAALEGEESGFLAGKHLITAFHSLLFDMQSASLCAHTRHPFSNEELCVFENVDTDTKLSSKGANYILLCDYLTTASGGAVLFQRQWRESHRQNGMELSFSSIRKGMVVANLDTLGNILWTRGIMQNNQHATLNVRGPYLLDHDGTICVITNEAKDESPEYNPSIAAKRSKSLLMANAALSAYCFSPDGKGSKQMLASDGKYLILSPLHHFGNGKYYFLSGGNAPQISYIILHQ